MKEHKHQLLTVPDHLMKIGFLLQHHCMNRFRGMQVFLTPVVILMIPVTTT